MKKLKISTGIIVMLIIQTMLCSISFADPSVNTNKDNAELKSQTLTLTEEISEQPEGNILANDTNTPAINDTTTENYDTSPKTADAFNFIAIIGLLLSGTMIIIQKSRLIKNRY